MRMLRPAEGPAGSAAGAGSTSPPWLYCHVPQHLREGLSTPPVWHTPLQRLRSITGIAFTSR